jgi:predicted ferric reductase
MTVIERAPSGISTRAWLWAPAASALLAGAVVVSGAGSQTVWDLIRASGIVAYVLLTLTVLAGLLVSSRSLPSGQSRIDFFEVHTFTSLLVLAFGSLHAAALLFDRYVGFSPREVLLPFASDYRPLAVGFGGLTLYLSAAVYGSFWVRRLIGMGTWRLLHYSSFLAFVLATYHGLFAGSDAGSTWLLGVYFGSMALVGGLLMYRVLIMSDERPSPVLEQLQAPVGAGQATAPEASAARGSYGRMD